MMTENVPQSSLKIRQNPFANMKIDKNDILNTIDWRSPCRKCNKWRKYFCYTCYIPVDRLLGHIPTVKLPLQIDIIKHKNEIDGKSTAAHAAILASENVRIYEYPDIPDYSKYENVFLIFPTPQSISVASLFSTTTHLDRSAIDNLPKGHNIGTLLKFKLDEIVNTANNTRSMEPWNINELPVKRVVFIDSTWNQCRGIYKDQMIRSLKTIVLQNRASQFWRHQQGSPRWYLSTIEAIHQFLLELHIHAWGLSRQYCGLEHLELNENFLQNVRIVDGDINDSLNDAISPYCGQYDNLLFFFTHMYNLIHMYYDHNKLKSYKRPMK